MFEAGDQVIMRGTGGIGVIAAAQGATMFRVMTTSGLVLVHLDELERVATAPDERLLARDLGEQRSYALRLQALYLSHAYRFDPLSGLSNARIEPQAHQVFVAWRVSQKLQPRMILADEVGLGKTIEAALVIKEMKARGLAERVLIVTPPSLQLQWQHELSGKFNEGFEIIDSSAVKWLSKDGANPWSRYPNVITSLPFVSAPNRVEKVLEADWDLVIFDEAHRVRRWKQGRSDKVTQAYRLADELKELTNGLLLLTATPMQLHPYELYSLIELVEPGLFPTFAHYEREHGRLPDLNGLLRALRSWDSIAPPERVELVERAGWALDALGLAKDQRLAQLEGPEGRDELADRVASLHPLANVLVRNRKSEIGGFKGRSAIARYVDLSNDELELYEDVTTFIREGYARAQRENNLAVGFLMVAYQKMLASSTHAIRASFENRVKKLRKRVQQLETQAKDSGKVVRVAVPTDEDDLDGEALGDRVAALEEVGFEGATIGFEIKELEELIERLRHVSDSKAGELLEQLDVLWAAHPGEKVLIFTAFLATQRFIRLALERDGIRVAIFNSKLSLHEKEDAVRAFRGPAQVLISTEAGGEGRNFQFCHWLFNYDLPWNPMKVEQRIGRLDRIGQTHKVQIVNLACRDTVEERVLRVLQDRIRLFEESVGSLDPILGHVEADITRLVMEQQTTLVDVEHVDKTLEQQVAAARERERVLADFALDRASLRKDLVNRLLEERPLATHEDLRTFTSSVLEHAGGVLSEHADGGSVVTISPQLSNRLGIKGPTIRGSFHPEEALELEEQDFFAFGHDLVDKLVRWPIDLDVSTTARTDPSMPRGEWLEAWWEHISEDLRPIGELRRHVVGYDLDCRSEHVRAMPQFGESAEGAMVPGWANDALRRSMEVAEQEYGAVRDEARATMAARQKGALERAKRIYEYRRSRLRVIIDSEQAWLSRIEEKGSDRERKVLPARRGKLAKRRAELEALAARYESEQEVILAQEPRTQSRLLACALVVNR